MGTCEANTVRREAKCAWHIEFVKVKVRSEMGFTVVPRYQAPLKCS